MKIVAISASQVPSSAANSIQALKAVHALAQLGHDVTLLVPQSSARPGWDDLASFYGLRTPFQVETLPGASRRLFFLLAVRRAARLNPGLLYVWPLQSAVLGLLHGLPVLLEMHDLPSGRVGPFWYRYFRDAKGRKRITVITRALKNALDDRYGSFLRPQDVILAPNGVDLERFADLPDPPTARRILALPSAVTVACAGHLYAGRGAELFLELAKQFPVAQFLWVGGKPADVETWQARAAAQGVSNLIFTGFIHNAQLPLYQAAADVLLMPYGREIGISSGGGHSAQVSSPMKMFEYLATGRAILASDLPVFHEVLNERNCVFCAPDEVGQWADALRALLGDPQRYADLASQARADAANYAWVERARRILAGFVENDPQ